MKKFLMVILQLPLITVAETETVDGIVWTYTANSGKVEVGAGQSGLPAISSSTVGAVAIPPTLGGMVVTSIGSGAFCGCKGVTSVTIPEGVKSIGDAAFKDCQGLQSVLIPSSVTSIGGDAFYGCKQLKSVDVPDSVNAIGSFAFAHCMNLTSIRLSSRLMTLSDMLFLNCSTLPAVVVPSNVVHIGKGAFYGCAVLNSVVLPESLRTIGDFAFAGFGAFSISKTMMVTEQRPVYDGHGVQIGEESVSTLVTAFEGGNLPACTNLSEIVIPVGVERVGDYAFRGCVGLKSVTIPSSVKDIGDYAFALSYWDNGIEQVVTLVEHPVLDANGNMVAVQTVQNIATVYVRPERMVGNAQLEAIDIPCGVEHIGECAFLGCEAIKKVSLPKTVTSVGRNAFSGCAGLMELRLDGSNARLGQGICACFGPVTNHIEYGHSITPSGSVVPITRSLISCGAACTNLSSVIIGSGVESLGADSFNGCDLLKFVTVEDGIRSIGERAFKDCRSLEKLHLPGSLIDVGENVFDGCCSLFDIAVPCALLRRQGVWALPSYQMLTNLIITGHGEMVADFGFRECTLLQSVEMSEGISGVDGYAFEGCGALQRMVLPSSCSMIGYGAFRACGSLKEVHIHGDAPDVADEAFFGTPRRLKFVVDEGTIGWSGGLTDDLPETWFGREIVYSGSEGREGGGDEGQESEDRPMLSALQIVTTNVVVHYVLNSVLPQFALPPSEETGLVNVITEVKGGAIVIPESWAANYPDFTAKFGGDFSKAMAASTGKKDGAGNDMFVWQDYVAGTDPTDETDVFTASITIVDGKVTISYSPELDDARKTMRKYTTWGKRSLMDTDWTEVQEGHESEYNFFKVSVEMR